MRTNTPRENIGTQWDNTITKIGAILTDQAARIHQGKEEGECEKQEEEEDKGLPVEEETLARPKPGNTGGPVRETRITSKPIRTQSITNTPTEFEAPGDVERMIFGDEPEEDELLTPTCVNTFLKRNKHTAELSTDEEIRVKRETKKQRHTKGEKDNTTYTVGAFDRTMANQEYAELRPTLEKGELTHNDKEMIMYHLIKERGETTSFHLEQMKKGERDEFVAYTCFLTAGNYYQLGSTKPKWIKTMWSDAVLKRWKNLGIQTKEKENTTVIHKYNSILAHVNKRSLNA